MKTKDYQAVLKAKPTNSATHVVVGGGGHITSSQHKPFPRSSLPSDLSSPTKSNGKGYKKPQD